MPSVPGSPRRHAIDSKRSTQPSRAADRADASPLRWASGAAALLGALLVGAFLWTADAASVFSGSALGQNLLCLLLAVLTAVTATRARRQFRFGPTAWLVVLASLLWLMLVTVWAGRENNPRVAWNGFWQIIALGAFYYSARALIAGPHARRAIAQVLLVGCVAVACQGLNQVFVDFPAERARYLADPESVLAEIPGVDTTAGSPSRKRFEDRLLYSSEPYGSYALANSLAVVLTGGLLLLIGLAFDRWRFAARSLAAKSWVVPSLCLSLSAGLLLVCWFLTRSRVAYLGLLAGAITWSLLNGRTLREHRRLLAGLLVFVGGATVAGVVWLLRNDSLVLSEAPKSISYRLEYWWATAAMLKDHWLLGIGLGNYQSYYPLYKLPQASEVIADPHNWILDLCINLSLPLAVVLIFWLGRQLFYPGIVAATSPCDPLSTATPVAAVAADEFDLRVGRFVIWGAVAGGAIGAGLLSLLHGHSWFVLAFTWLPAALLVWLFQPMWPASDASHRQSAQAASIAMLTCLLASGSWQASGIALPLLSMLVIGRNFRPALADSHRVRQTGRAAQWKAIGLPTLGLLCFVVQCWRPTTTSWSCLQQAMVARSAQQQLELADAAVAADPLDAEPRRWRSQLLTQQAYVASRGEFPELAAKALQEIDGWLAWDSVKSLNWESAGHQSLELAARAQILGIDHRKWVDSAVGYYSQAVARYSTNIGLRAQLAATLAIAEQWPQAQEQLQIATELDRATPHVDKKLAVQLLWLPLLPREAADEFADAQPWVAAEPMLEWLRSKRLP